MHEINAQHQVSAQSAVGNKSGMALGQILERISSDDRELTSLNLRYGPWLGKCLHVGLRDVPIDNKINEDSDSDSVYF
jgi:hypothetical protein